MFKVRLMEKVSILILVLAGDTKLSNRNLEVMEETWMKSIPEGIKIIKYSGGNTVKYDGTKLTVNSPDNYESLSFKALEAFKWVSENITFDYIFRTNTSSYVDLENLKKFCENNTIKHLYRGRVLSNKFNNLSIQWASGAEILMSKNTFDVLIDKQNTWNVNLVDDVSIGQILHQNQITPANSESVLFDKKFFQKSNLSHEYHIRCRVDSPFYYPRYIEKYLIRYVHRELHSKNIPYIKRVIYRIFFGVSKIFAITKHKEYLRHYFWKALKKVFFYKKRT